MPKRKPLTDSDGEVRELTARDLKTVRRYSGLPATEQRKLRRVRGPQKAPTKERLTIRLSRDVVSQFRASGAGWQARVDDALRAWLRRNSPDA